jgi:hypothetical protein
MAAKTWAFPRSELMTKVTYMGANGIILSLQGAIPHGWPESFTVRGSMMLSTPWINQWVATHHDHPALKSGTLVIGG